jgi:hypothetical protein
MGEALCATPVATEAHLHRPSALSNGIRAARHPQTSSPDASCFRFRLRPILCSPLAAVSASPAARGACLLLLSKHSHRHLLHLVTSCSIDEGSLSLCLCCGLVCSPLRDTSTSTTTLPAGFVSSALTPRYFALPHSRIPPV